MSASLVALSAVLSLRRQGAVFVLNGEKLTVRGTPEVRQEARARKPEILAELRSSYVGSWLDLTVEQMQGLSQGSVLRGFLKSVDEAGRRTGGTLADALAVADGIGAQGVKFAAIDHLPGFEGRELVDATKRVFESHEVDTGVFE